MRPARRPRLRALLTAQASSLSSVKSGMTDMLASHEEYVDGLKQIIADALSQFDAKASSFVA